jgi:hypothetical protein
MKDSKVLNYLSIFDKHGLNRLERHLISPCNYVYPNVIKLFCVLKELHPEFEEDSVVKEKIFAQVFGARKFSPQEMANNMKYLAGAIEEFLIQEQVKKKEGLKMQLLAEKLRYSSPRLHKDAIDKLSLALQKNSGAETAENLFHQLSHHHEKDIYFSMSEAREQNEEIQLKNNCLDTWYAYQKLKTWCEMLNRQNIVAVNYEYTLQRELLAFINEKGAELFKNAAVEIFYTIYLSLTEPEDETHFKTLMRLLQLNEDAIAVSELRSMYDFAQNYCIKKLNSGNIAYAEILFNIYNHLLEKKIILNENENLSQWDFKNIVALSLRLKKNTWCRNFIEEKKTLVEKQSRENAYVYNLAYYYALTENYKEAKRLLQKVEFSDLFYQLGSKSILLRCYYELEDEASFLSHCEAFTKLLLRNKTISDYQRKVHLNLILYTRKAFRLMLRKMENRKNVSKKEIEKLKDKIAGVKQINNLPWLLEKLNELSA